ncbi:hypothetical protein [Cobetia marina]|uniref:hypothetical protein n=1 Tax=Cobetia marina TaxID=28258 RepID=UPI001141ACCB|nr:hypothetical protein [Cobetia marina]GED41220.1 hypothetical protein HHA02_05490 [Cobetia marina]
MNIERLEIMATILDEVEAGTWQRTVPYPHALETTLVPTDVPVHFSMECWGFPSVGDHDTPCGYSACAIGHAILDKRLPELVTSDNTPAFVPQYRDDRCWDAVEAYFDLTEDQADRIFNQDSYINADGVRAIQVATRIRALTGGYWS